MTIRDLEPKIVWENFYALTRIPRPSKHEGKVREYLLDWGRRHGIETVRDETGNIIMRKAATPGEEHRRGVILQGHMDMVPQKTADVDHDFLKDPIRTLTDGEWVTADRTTLGADNGIGVALALSVLQSDDLRHGPLEVLVTYDEETGMTGAKSLRPDVLKGSVFLNLDSEMEGELCIGCAGGLDGHAEFSFRETDAPAGCLTYRLSVKGLHGGHSGMDISCYYANANKLLVRILLPLMEQCGAHLASIKGGSLRNAIPFEGEAVVLVPEAQAAAAERLVEGMVREIKEETRHSDPDGRYGFEKTAAAGKYIEDETALRAVRAILACPHGVVRMSDSMPGLTETSTNLAIVDSGNGKLTVDSLMRSAVDSSKAFLSEQLRAVFTLAGASYSTSGGYNGWTPKPDTPSYALVKAVYQKLFHKEMTVMATHGGLECAILGAKYPEWEMISIGPTILHPHSPDEKVNVRAVANAWEFVKGILAEI